METLESAGCPLKALKVNHASPIGPVLMGCSALPVCAELALNSALAVTMAVSLRCASLARRHAHVSHGGSWTRRSTAPAMPMQVSSTLTLAAMRDDLAAGHGDRSCS